MRLFRHFKRKLNVLNKWYFMNNQFVSWDLIWIAQPSTLLFICFVSSSSTLTTFSTEKLFTSVNALLHFVLLFAIKPESYTELLVGGADALHLGFSGDIDGGSGPERSLKFSTFRSCSSQSAGTKWMNCSSTKFSQTSADPCLHPTSGPCEWGAHRRAE